MKNIIRGIIFSILFLTGYASVNAASDFTYELDGSGNATITSYKGSATSVTIPSTIDGHSVVKIGDHAFNESRNSTHCKGIKTVTISEGIKSVGDFAFVDCNTITTVNLPNSLTSLGTQTFIGCTSLKKINIPTNLKKLDYLVFQETGFTEFVIPAGFQEIGSNAFRLVKSLKTFKVYSRNVIYNMDVFEYHSNDLILYGYKGSTTETYAKQNGITFKDINDYKETINVSSVTLNRNIASMKVGDSVTLIATVLPNNATNKTVNWKSSNPNVATVSGGVVKALKPGTAEITVTSADGSRKATCSVKVAAKTIAITSIKLDKESLTMSIGDTYKLTATILPENATNKKLTWSSSDPTTASVSSDGTITAIREGKVTISVSNSDKSRRESAIVTITKKEIPIKSMSFESKNMTLFIGEEKTLNLNIEPKNNTENTLTWRSSDASVVSIENGKIKGLKEGTSTISVTNESGNISAKIDITVVKKSNVLVSNITLDKTRLILNVGDSNDIIATISPDNATNKNLIWSSDNPSVATVSNGRVTALNEGNATISVKSEDGLVEAICMVNVNPKDSLKITSITLEAHELTILAKESGILTPDIKPSKADTNEIVWYSSNNSVAIVKDGVVTGIRPGTATIFISNKEGTITDSCLVTVSVNPNANKKKDKTFIYLAVLIGLVMGVIILIDVVFKKKKVKGQEVSPS